MGLSSLRSLQAFVSPFEPKQRSISSWMWLPRLVLSFATRRTGRPLQWRRQQLSNLRRMMEENLDAIAKATNDDLRRPYTEAVLFEVWDVIAETIYFQKNLESFNKKEKLRTPLNQRPLSFEVSWAYYCCCTLWLLFQNRVGWFYRNSKLSMASKTVLFCPLIRDLDASKTLVINTASSLWMLINNIPHIHLILLCECLPRLGKSRVGWWRSLPRGTSPSCSCWTPSPGL